MKGYLHLNSGESFEGQWLTNAPTDEIKGEIVFFTGMARISRSINGSIL